MKPVLKFLSGLSPEEKEEFTLFIKEASGCYDEDGNLTASEGLITVREVEEFLLPVIEAGAIPASKQFQKMMKRLDYTEDDILSMLAGYGAQMGVALSAR
jgi:hypothetical protein